MSEGVTFVTNLDMWLSYAKHLIRRKKQVETLVRVITRSSLQVLHTLVAKVLISK